MLAAPPPSDPRTAERQKLLAKLMVAEGRAKISKAADEVLKAGFTRPEEQDVHLQLLEHADEEQVRSAIGTKPKHRGTLRALGLRGRLVRYVAERVKYYVRMRENSSGVRPCCRTSSGVICGSPGRAWAVTGPASPARR